MDRRPDWIDTPIQWLSNDVLSEYGISLGIKRLDLIHPVYGGNKLLKLWNLFELNLEELRSRGIVSMGGPHSNHAFSLAGLCNELQVPLRLMIRGHKGEISSFVLRQLESWGVELVWKAPEAFRLWRDEGGSLCQQEFPGALWVPEGGSWSGTNAAFRQLALEISAQGLGPSDLFILPAGTGGTTAGLIPWMAPEQRMIVVNCVPGFPMDERLQSLTGTTLSSALSIWGTQQLGRFGKTNRSLVTFARQWQVEHEIPLDPVYTSRMYYLIWEKIRSGEIERGTRILTLHTGGMAGAFSWEEKNRQNFIPPGIRPDIGRSGQK